MFFICPRLCNQIIWGGMEMRKHVEIRCQYVIPVLGAPTQPHTHTHTHVRRRPLADAANGGRRRVQVCTLLAVLLWV